MSFSSLSDFLAMGGHGPYVWSAYAITLAGMAFLLISPWLARRRYLREESRRLRREESRP